jgi:hypothetical protein
MNGKDEIVFGLRNDGCVAPPGQITILAVFPDGRESSTELPVGELAPGVMRLYALPTCASGASSGVEKEVRLSMKIQIKGKRSPVQWVVKKEPSADAFVLRVPLKPL